MGDIGRIYLDGLRQAFAGQRDLAERAVAQLSPNDLTRQLDAESNSVEMLMRHIGGNLSSRFADFLETDGEKAERDRDGEFVASAPGEAAESARRAWDAGWATLEAALGALSPDDLERTVRIRGVAHTVPGALERSLAHTSHHVGQIVFLAKHLRSEAWRTLSIPRGQSRTWRPPSA